MHAQSKVETRTKNTHTLQLEDELKKNVIKELAVETRNKN